MREERATVLRANRERIRKGDTSPESVKLEKDQLRVLANKERDLKLDCWVQAGYLPLTAHWCVTYLLSRNERRPDILHTQVHPGRHPAEQRLGRGLRHGGGRVWPQGSLAAHGVELQVHGL